jgi:uncharacterized protein YcfL
MNAKSIDTAFWSRVSTIFMIVMLVLAALPIQPVSAAEAGFSAPSIYSNSTLLNAGNAYVSDNVYAQGKGSNKSAEYGNFGFNIPAGSTINLVEVSVEGYGNKNWKVAVSKNNGATYSAFTTIVNTAIETTTVTGGTGTLWGLTGWTATSLNDANFRVKIASAGGNPKNNAFLDQLLVKVTYSLASSTPTTLVLTAPSANTYGGTVDLQATLTQTSGGLPLSGKTIAFTLDGFSKGTATTNASGVATLSGVTLTAGLSGTLLNVGTYNVSATFQGDSTYAFSSDTKSQVINQRAITVTADAKSKAYGTVDPALTYSFAPALIGTDTFSGALTRIAGEDIGTHAITQGTLALSPNYALTYVGANLTITALGITVTADNKAVHAGDTDPTFTFAVSRFVGLDAFLTPPTCGVSVPHTVAGTYPIVCSGGNAGTNYSITYNNGTLTVTNKVVLTVTADPKSIAYGDTDPIFTFTYSGFVDGDTAITGTSPTCSVAGLHNNVGSYPSIACSGGLDSKYEFSYTSGKLTVNPLAVTVTADAKIKVYGDADPVLTYGVAPALVSGDSFSGALVRTVGEDVASYAINQGTLALNANYVLTYVGANLTINQAPLTVTADDQGKGVGGVDPLFTFNYTGFVNGEDSSVIDTSPTCGVSVVHTAVGTYPITCSGGLDNDYSFIYVGGTLTIVKNQMDAYIGGNYMASYFLNSNQSFRGSFQGVNSGPVEMISANSAPFILAEREIYSVNGVDASFTELMALPNNQLDKIYWLPWYNNTGLDTQLRFGNVSGVAASVHVYIGGTEMVGSPFALAASGAGQSTRVNFAGINNGPVQIVSDQNIVAAEREIYKVGGVDTSFSEIMALPNNQLDKTYWLPWYNNTGLDTQLRIGNVSGVAASVHVYIGGTEMPGSPFALTASGAGQSTRLNFAGVNNGPVRIVSDQNIVAAEREIYKVKGVDTSFTELMALPNNQLDKTYWLPWYNNTGLDTQLRIGNVSGVAASVHVFVGGTEMPGSPFALTGTGAGQSTRLNFAGVNNGPVQIVSDQDIVAAERLIYKVGGVDTSFSEMMALPNSQLSTTFWLPWYNDTGLDTQLRFAVP